MLSNQGWTVYLSVPFWKKRFLRFRLQYSPSLKFNTDKSANVFSFSLCIPIAFKVFLWSSQLSPMQNNSHRYFSIYDRSIGKFLDKHHWVLQHFLKIYWIAHHWISIEIWWTEVCTVHFGRPFWFMEFCWILYVLFGNLKTGCKKQWILPSEPWI